MRNLLLQVIQGTILFQFKSISKPSSTWSDLFPEINETQIHIDWLLLLLFLRADHFQAFIVYSILLELHFGWVFFTLLYKYSTYSFRASQYTVSRSQTMAFSLVLFMFWACNYPCADFFFSLLFLLNRLWIDIQYITSWNIVVVVFVLPVVWDWWLLLL